jgi:hypothetical protein
VRANGQYVRVTVWRWFRNAWLREGTSEQQRKLAKAVAHPIRTVMFYAILFGAIEWVLWIRSGFPGGLVGLSVASVTWALFVFGMLKWRHRDQFRSFDGPLPGA